MSVIINASREGDVLMVSIKRYETGMMEQGTSDEGAATAATLAEAAVYNAIKNAKQAGAIKGKVTIIWHNEKIRLK